LLRHALLLRAVHLFMCLDAAAAVPLSFDICCPPGLQQQTRLNGMQRSIDGKDGRTP